MMLGAVDDACSTTYGELLTACICWPDAACAQLQFCVYFQHKLNLWKTSYKHCIVQAVVVHRIERLLCRDQLSENIDQNQAELFEEMGVDTDNFIGVSHADYAHILGDSKRRRA